MVESFDRTTKDPRKGRLFRLGQRPADLPWRGWIDLATQERELRHAEQVAIVGIAQKTAWILRVVNFAAKHADATVDHLDGRRFVRRDGQQPNRPR